MSAICLQCSGESTLMEFPTVKILNEHIKSGHKTKPEGWTPRKKRITLEQANAKRSKNVKKTSPTASSGEKKPPKKPTPILLAYKYSGTCPDCDNELDTISVSVGKKDSVIAYCAVCKKQHKETKVVPLPK